MIGIWKSTTDSVHRALRDEGDLPARLRVAADVLRGRPYRALGLVGGADDKERLVVDLATFDCVTFVESALALASSTSRTGFVRELKRWRYRDAQVDWRARLHYFSDWMRAHQRRGAVRIQTRGEGSRVIHETLGLIKELRKRRVRIHVVPKRLVHRALPRISDGAVIAFASVRARLDFFHTGLVFHAREEVRSADDLMLYHASRTRRRVVREPLGVFLKRNRMRGIAFATPISRDSRGQS